MLCLLQPPERSYVNICTEPAGVGAEFDGGLGSGEGGRGQQEGQRGGARVRRGETQPLSCPEVASRVA